MERLTKYFYENDVGIDCTKCGRKDIGKCNTSEDCASSCADRLAAIEDILGDTYDLDHLRELVEADKAGRCVIIPSCDEIISAIEAAGQIGEEVHP